MTTADMLQTVQSRLAADPTLIRWCVDTLGQPPVIQLDFDESVRLDDPTSGPGAELFPLICLMAVTHSSGIQQRSNRWGLSLLCAVRDSRQQRTVVRDSGHSVTTISYPGRLHAEGLREQVALAIYRIGLGKVDISSEAPGHSYHPNFFAPMTVTITERT